MFIMFIFQSDGAAWTLPARIWRTLFSIVIWRTTVYSPASLAFSLSAWELFDGIVFPTLVKWQGSVPNLPLLIFQY